MDWYRKRQCHHPSNYLSIEVETYENVSVTVSKERDNLKTSQGSGQKYLLQQHEGVAARMRTVSSNVDFYRQTHHFPKRATTPNTALISRPAKITFDKSLTCPPRRGTRISTWHTPEIALACETDKGKRGQRTSRGARTPLLACQHGSATLAVFNTTRYSSRWSRSHHRIELEPTANTYQRLKRSQLPYCRR